MTNEQDSDKTTKFFHLILKEFKKTKSLFYTSLLLYSHFKLISALLNAVFGPSSFLLDRIPTNHDGDSGMNIIKVKLVTAISPQQMATVFHVKKLPRTVVMRIPRETNTKK